ncbi:MAG: Nif11-like leader peptide family RiPP precursor [Pseudomonadota bacterium]
MQTVRQFLTEVVSNNPELQARIEKAATLGEIVEISASAGYQLTKDSLEEFIKSQLSGNELSMDEMATVAGGGEVTRPRLPLGEYTLLMGCYVLVPTQYNPSLCPK